MNTKPTEPTIIKSNYPSPHCFEQFLDPVYPVDNIIDILKDAVKTGDIADVDEYYKDKYYKEGSDIVARLMEILLKHSNLQATVYALSFSVNLPLTDCMSMNKAAKICNMSRYGMTKHVALIQKELGIKRNTRKQWLPTQRENLKQIKSNSKTPKNKINQQWSAE